MRCACHGRWESVRRLLPQCSPNTRGQRTYGAALRRRPWRDRCARGLIAAGASVSATDSLGVSPPRGGIARTGSVHASLRPVLILLCRKGGQLVGRTPADIARHVGSVECVSLIVNVCWLSCRSSQLAVVAEPAAGSACRVTNSTWRQLVLAGRQLGVMSTVPPPIRPYATASCPLPCSCRGRGPAPGPDV